MTIGNETAGPPDYREYPHLLHRSRGQQRISELIVRRCLTDPKFLKRYYLATLWTGLLIRARTFPDETEAKVLPIVVYNTLKGFSKGRESENWWFASNFVLLTHARSRDDLVKGIGPEDLKEQVAAFKKWFDENYAYLQVDPQ